MRGRRSRGRGRPRSPRPRRHRWATLPTEELLDVRLCDLGLRIEGSPLESRVARLHRELERAGLRFRPYVWLSTDWFSPQGTTGFAVPFFLAHARLARLESRIMLQVEGGEREWCMRLMRHEAAHALDHAYRLHHRRRWREVFGSYGAPYRASYVPRFNSRRHVLNLDHGYAQSHPVEDFAETFAVWLQPRSVWRRAYAKWPALDKLEYVDQLMREIAGQLPRTRTRERMDSLPTIRMTLREYYRRKRRHYGEDGRSVYDQDLRRLFGAEPPRASRRPAARFLRERRAELRRQVATWTGQHAFVVDEVLKGMIVRCRELSLGLDRSQRETAVGAAALLTVHTVRHSRMRHREFFR
jgi:hypothetical protein